MAGASSQHGQTSIFIKGYAKLELIRPLTNRGWAQTYVARSGSKKRRIVKTGVSKTHLNVLKKVSLIATEYFPKVLAFDKDEASGGFRVVLNFMEGSTLRETYDIEEDWTIAQTKLPDYQKARLLTLNFLELQELLVRNGLLYRDVQPGNIIMKPNGSLGIIDFEQCEVSKNSQSRWECQRVQGAWETSPPEELMAPAIQGEDAAVYRVGALHLLLVNGYMPFKVSEITVPNSQQRKEATLLEKQDLRFLKTLPVNLREVFEQLLHPDKLRRTPTLAAARSLIEEA